jgi:hypothetical protein
VRVSIDQRFEKLKVVEDLREYVYQAARLHHLLAEVQNDGRVLIRLSDDVGTR